MRKLLTILLLLCAIPAQAQGVRKALFVSDRDFDASDFTFCVTTGVNADPYGPPRQGTALIATSGSSTTVSAVTANTLPFALLGVGDIIHVTTAPGTTAMRRITAKASGDSITVDTAITIPAAGLGFTWRQVTCGTAATSGWIDVSAYSDVTITFKINQMNAASVDLVVQCENVNIDSAVTQVFPPSPTGSGVCETGNFTAAMSTQCAVNISSNTFDRCRFGVDVNTDDGDDLTTNAEDITANLSARVRN